MEWKVYQRVYKQKLVSVVCEEVADKQWSNGTVDYGKSVWRGLLTMLIPLSQESALKVQIQMQCQIVQKTGISKTLVHRIVNET